MTDGRARPRAAPEEGDNAVWEITCRYAGRTRSGFSRKQTLDSDLRPGELECAVARAKQGDPVAFAYLYLRFADNIYGYTRSIVEDDHEAEDIVQQVFARLITAIRSYEPRGVPFSAWLLRIARNMAIDHLRRQRAVPTESGELSEDARETDGALALALRDSLAELPDGQREVVVLRHVAGLSHAEIADCLRRSEQSVHALHHRGRRTLMAGLTQREVAPAAAA